jgi:hypothetical protein
MMICTIQISTSSPLFTEVKSIDISEKILFPAAAACLSP